MKKWNIRHRPKYLLFSYQNVVALLGCFSDIMLRNYHLILFFLSYLPSRTDRVWSWYGIHHTRLCLWFSRHLSMFVCKTCRVAFCNSLALPNNYGREYVDSEIQFTHSDCFVTGFFNLAVSPFFSFSSSGAGPIASKLLCSGNRAAARVPAQSLLPRPRVLQ